MVNNALEPFWAARVEGMSDGFRPGRGCHDAIQTICCVARPNTTRPWVVDADLEGAFDHIGHAALLQAMGNFPARGLLQQWLKAGYMEEKRLHPTEPGVPQGGVISPWLLTVALHGMEHARGRSSTPRGTRRGAYALGRYAADLPVFCPTQEEAIEAKALLAQWLRTRGWRRSEAKTPIRPLTEGVTFLGFNSRHDPAPQRSRSGVKLLMNPSQDSIQRIQRPLKGLWRTPVGSPTGALSNAMPPVIRGGSQYFRRGMAKRVFMDLDTFRYVRAAVQATTPPAPVWLVENPAVLGPDQGTPAGPVGLDGYRAPCHPQAIRLDTNGAASAGPQDVFPRRPKPPGLLETATEQTPSPGGSPAATRQPAAGSLPSLSPGARQRRGPARA
jgi:RNA-directed DNA polymerase